MNWIADAFCVRLVTSRGSKLEGLIGEGSAKPLNSRCIGLGPIDIGGNEMPLILKNVKHGKVRYE